MPNKFYSIWSSVSPFSLIFLISSLHFSSFPHFPHLFPPFLLLPSFSSSVPSLSLASLIFLICSLPLFIPSLPHTFHPLLSLSFLSFLPLFLPSFPHTFPHLPFLSSLSSLPLFPPLPSLSSFPPFHAASHLPVWLARKVDLSEDWLEKGQIWGCVPFESLCWANLNTLSLNAPLYCNQSTIDQLTLFWNGTGALYHL